jgi:hypothetical protein
MTLSVPSSVGLTCSSGWATASPYNTGTAAAGISRYVSGISKAQVTFTSSKISTSNAYGASIAYYKIVYGSETSAASPYLTPVLSGTGTKSLTAYVYDSRGRYVSATLSFDVLSYAKPTLMNISAYRSTSSGAASDEGTYISVKADAVYSDLAGGNTAALRARYKTADGDYGSYTTLTSGVAKVLGGGAISTASTYTVEISLSDGLGYDTAYTETIPTASVFFQGNDRGTAAAFGKYVEEDDALDVGWDLIVRGDVYGPVRSLGKHKHIEAGEDVNDYLDFGTFAVQNNVAAEGIANIPIQQAGILTVSSATGDGKRTGNWVYILQEYRTFDGKYNHYRLCCTNGSGVWEYKNWEAKSNRFWSELGLSSNVSASASNFGRYTNGNCYYRVVDENHVYVAFNCAFTYSGSAVVVNKNAIPEGYRPARNVYAMCAVGGRSIARIYVNSSGNVGVDWIQVLTAGAATTSANVSWVDGYIDYWV